MSRRKTPFQERSSTFQSRVRFLAYHRIKPHVPPLVRAPVNSFEFHRCRRTPQVDYLTLSLWKLDGISQTPSNHRLLRGLPGYLILFDTHAFVLQCQSQYGKLPSQSEFLVISMHFTATPRIPPAAAELKPGSFNGRLNVERSGFTADLPNNLRTL